MKKWMAAAAMFGMSACLENPGVDERLPLKHDRLSSDFEIAHDGNVRVRLSRTDAGTELFLDNLGPRAVDSLEFYLQIMTYPVPQNAGNYPELYLSYLDQYPLAEFHGKVIGLKKDAEIDLGPLIASFPRHMDDLSVLFFQLNGSVGGLPAGSPSSGYFTGSVSALDSARDVSPASFSGLAAGSLFYSKSRGSALLTGSVRHDTLLNMEYLGNWSGGAPPGIDLGGLMEKDTATIQVMFHNVYVPSDSVMLKVSLTRPPVPRFVAP